MIPCIFVSDLHGRLSRYQKLFNAIRDEKPTAVFLGGDLLPSGLASILSNATYIEDFIHGYIEIELEKIREELGTAYPRIFMILGNDDPRIVEDDLEAGESKGLWEYIHNRSTKLGDHLVYGYACVPPTPFMLKDWERYDVSQYVDPGCIPLDEGWYSVPFQVNEVKFATIRADLEVLTGDTDLSKAVFLFHAPPYQTKVDRAGLDGRYVDHVPMDVNVGSIAIRRFIEGRKPQITLHGHIHESARITGSWQDRIGSTVILSAAHDKDELALVRFDLQAPETATRELL
jgi:uncharacterized protein